MNKTKLISLALQPKRIQAHISHLPRELQPLHLCAGVFMYVHAYASTQKREMDRALCAAPEKALLFYIK